MKANVTPLWGGLHKHSTCHSPPSTRVQAPAIFGNGIRCAPWIQEAGAGWTREGRPSDAFLVLSENHGCGGRSSISHSPLRRTGSCPERGEVAPLHRHSQFGPVHTARAGGATRGGRRKKKSDTMRWENFVNYAGRGLSNEPWPIRSKKGTVVWAGDGLRGSRSSNWLVPQVMKKGTQETPKDTAGTRRRHPPHHFGKHP